MLQNSNFEEDFEKLGINDYAYSYEPIFARQDKIIPITPPPPKQKSPILRIIIVLSFLMGFYVGKETDNDFFLNNEYKKEGPNGIIANQKKIHREQSTIELFGELSKQKSIQEKLMKQKLGIKQFNLIFENPLIIEKMFLTDQLSRERLRRRLMIKIIEAQLNENSPINNNLNEDDLSTFIWATGGDSSAAGHGNLFEQSYTKVMEETVKGAFRALGIEFQGRNYAMGGYTSAPELALCMEAIYGDDLDILAWDFSTTEETYSHLNGLRSEPSMNEEELGHKASLWGHRAGIHPTKPILFMVDSSRKSMRWEKMNKLVERGMGTVLMDSEVISEMFQVLPITRTVNPTEEDVQFRESLPPVLQYLRCEDASIEGSLPCNDPMNYLYCLDDSTSICNEKKFDTHEVCTDARNQRSYNPGWKMHFLKGKLLGYFLIEMLSEALLEINTLLSSPIATGNPYDNMYETNILNDYDDKVKRHHLQHLFDLLQSKEKEDKDLFHNTPSASHEWTSHLDTVTEVNLDVLYRSHAMCHTALLPSQTRFEGILTETQNSQEDTFVKGTNKVYLQPIEDGNLPLVWDPNSRQKCTALEIDHKDFFFVRTDDDWVSTVLPNPTELKTYGTWGKQLSAREGLIMVCLRTCPLHECHPEHVGFDSIRKGVLSAKVDDAQVVGAKQLDECHFLQGAQGLRWGVEKDQYKLSFKIEPKTGKFMKISSIIIF